VFLSTYLLSAKFASGQSMHFTPFFEFVILVVVIGALIVLATAAWSANAV
jgi:hypothetical protein